MNLFRYPWWILKENGVYAKRTLEMSFKELHKRYSGAALGAFWALVRPLLFIFVYWFAVSVGIRGGGAINEHPYVLYLIGGIIPWFFVSETLVYGAKSLRANKHLITKMVYPVSTIPTFSILSQLYVHVAMTGIVVVIFALSGYPPTVHTLQLLYYTFCLFVFMTVLSWTTAALAVVSRDFEHLIKSTTQMLFWLTPIIWHIGNVKGVLKLVVMANPINYFVSGYRDSLLNQRWFFDNPLYTLYFWGVTLLLAFFGAYVFHRLKDEFADIL
ncbi:ABC transporter permease [Alkalibacter rhizosphaerae]|uniref:Transport permease protein n=1 Tax=Alkalibacter rhizosphaerae TaxID=2815577 RepID=A0A974XNV7_9FIRM|nr:ABC transporter permease [Alkalibacter rhizosphaerae]QSX09301.1 ABC transporter permease [Alkalibacter rhizosphaerae]